MSGEVTPNPLALQSIETILKALADESRLRLLGAATGREMSIEELALAIGGPPTLLEKSIRILCDAGFLRERTEGARTVYRCDLAPLREALKNLRTPGVRPGAPQEAGDESRSILRRFFDGTKLRNMPSKTKDKELVLQEILRRLPRAEEFAEKDLNTSLKDVFEDFCTIRRELVDGQFLSRSEGIYRLTEKGKGVINA